MTGLLTICIPTYKRPITLRRCIISVAEQIQRFRLEDRVRIYVANDASPDNTVQVLDEFSSLNYFRHVNREKNLGMSANIKRMLEEALLESNFQLIITDDDYLHPDALEALVEFLTAQLAENPDTPLIWTPRYSYTEDGGLHCVVCKPFREDTLIPPSLRNAGRHMHNGFVLSGLIVRSAHIDFSLWQEHLENAYFPVIFSGDLISRKPSFYWERNLVHHSVLNECHWERWGSSDAEISLRLFIDFLNAYVAIGSRVTSASQAVLFYASSFPSICRTTGTLLSSSGFSRLSHSESVALLNTGKVSFSNVEPAARIVLFVAAIRILSGCLFSMARYKLLSFVPSVQAIKERRHQASLQNSLRLENAAFLLRWAR